jgi:hypothetical protein
VYEDLSEFRAFVASADSAFGDNSCLIAHAREGTKYVHIKCKFVGCVYNWWYNYTGNFKKIQYFRNINTSHTIESHKNGIYHED